MSKQHTQPTKAAKTETSPLTCSLHSSAPGVEVAQSCLGREVTEAVQEEGGDRRWEVASEPRGPCANSRMRDSHCGLMKG